MAEWFAGGHLRFVNGAWRNDDGDPVEIQQVGHGYWVKSKSMILSAKCSVCKSWVTRHSVNEPYFRFCPNCGAKMDGGVSDDRQRKAN